MSLANKLKQKGVSEPLKPSTQPLWCGPESDGVTFSMLSRFLACRERFRVYAVEGLKPVDTWNHKISYGSMWHHAEQALAACTGDPTISSKWREATDWAIQLYARILATKYPAQGQQIEHWYNVCKVQFPLYVDYWSRHPDTMERRPVLQEHVFDVQYQLPSGRMVRLRGRWDAVDMLGKKHESGLYLRENKTRGEINEQRIKRQLTYDLQTGIYLVALSEWASGPGGFVGKRPLKGVVYNVVRRPLSGGKGTIVRKKPTRSNPDGESKAEYYNRLGQYIKDAPDTYFMRWRMEVTSKDIQRFRAECLDPLLEQLCEWYTVITTIGADRLTCHWKQPYGIWGLEPVGFDEIDEYLASGSILGLERVDNLFRELED